MKLRSDIKFYKYDENTFHMHDVLNDKHFKIGNEQKEWLQLFDGNRTFEEIQKSVPSEYIDQLMEYIDKFNLLEGSEKKNKKINKFKIKYRIIELDRYLNKISNICKIYAFLLNRTFYILLFLNIYLLYLNSSSIFLNFSNLLTSPNIIYITIFIYFLIFISGCLHELSHAFVAKSNNVAIPHIGIMLFYFNPAFYVDLSGISILKSKSERIKILTAGIKMNNLLLFLTLILFVNSEFTLIKEITSIYIMLTLITILINIIPFIEFDGYFIYSTIISDKNLKLTASKQLTYLKRKKFYKVQIHYILFFVYSVIFSSSFIILGVLSIVQIIGIGFIIPSYIVVFLIAIVIMQNVKYQLKKVVI